MKMKLLGKRLLTAGFLACSVKAYSQGTLGNGTFQDLDFESAVVVPVAGTDNQIEAGPAFPGWSVTIGGVTQSTVAYPYFDESIQIDRPAVALLGAGYGPLAGNYSAVLQAGPSAGWPVAAISQTAMVPSGAVSVRFMTSDYLAPVLGALSINGATVPFSEVPSSNQGVFTFGANIGAYAGKVVTLSFSALPTPVVFTVDDISFSSVAVPEPSCWVLACVGGCLLGGFRRALGGRRAVTVKLLLH